MEKINKIYKVSLVTTIMHGINIFIFSILSTLTIITIFLLGRQAISRMSLIERTGGDQVGGWAKFFGMIDVFFASVGIIVILIFLVITLIPFILNLIATIQGANAYKNRMNRDVLKSIKRNNILKIVSNSISIPIIGITIALIMRIKKILYVFEFGNTLILEIIVIIFLLSVALSIGLIIAEAININRINNIKK